MATISTAFVKGFALQLRARPVPSLVPRCSVDFSPSRRPPDGSISSKLLRWTRPKPVLLARRNLDQAFAVLLMRTSYDVLDGLDIVPMDRFQREFFERRQTEWSYYLEDNANSVTQGMLTDPRYFDFISFAQLLTITDVMAVPESTFVEAFNAAGETRVVRRDLSIGSDPQEILRVFVERAGNAILAKVLELDSNRIPLVAIPGAAFTIEDIASAVRVLMSRFYFGGFCLEEPQVTLNGKNRIVVDFVGPAVLWGTKALAQLRAIPNEYDVWCVTAFLRQHCSDWALSGPVQTFTTDSSLSRVYKLIRIA